MKRPFRPMRYSKPMNLVRAKTIEIMKHCVMFIAMSCYTTPPIQGLATMLPPAWLLQHRAWEPLVATIAVYGASAAISWYLFIVSVLMMAAYFHRIQHRLIRNYSIFTEHYFWLVCAARSTAEAQMICRKMDPKAKFDFSYVGPPEPADTLPRPSATKVDG